MNGNRVERFALGAKGLLKREVLVGRDGSDESSDHNFVLHDSK